MIIRLSGILAALVLLTGTVGVATAGQVYYPNATDALPIGEGNTYLDLLQVVVPGISVNGQTFSAGEPIRIRHLSGWNEEEVEIAPTGNLQLASAPVRSGGLDRMALLVDFGETEFRVGFAILALFDPKGEPSLLDVADVASGRWTSFMDPARLSAGADDDLLVIQSTHHNSSQGYATTALILVRNDRFELVDTIALLSDRDCAYERRQNLVIEQGTGEPLAEIVATVSERTTLTANDCNGRTGPEPGSRTITVAYRWDFAAQRYTPDSDTLTVLARENEERF